MQRNRHVPIGIALSMCLTTVFLCCVPVAYTRNVEEPTIAAEQLKPAKVHEGMALVPQGKFSMGTEDGKTTEKPVHEVALKAFWMDKRDVTVAEFKRFAAATGYKTDAEKRGWSSVFLMETSKWGRADGADWKHPDGADKPPASPNEPVTQVSWNDATAYATWAGKRLPTEAEWEYAARGGLKNAKYCCGSALKVNGKFIGNYWQGEFPAKNTGEDGYKGRAPVGKFPPNGYGLYDMAGNVWQWCADWWGVDYYKNSPAANPIGPTPTETTYQHSVRGGSWMCSENYCQGYRVAARGRQDALGATNNTGFRCALNK